MRKQMMWTGPALLLATGLAACGGDDDSGECASFSACGGNPVGAWSFEDVCIEAADLMIQDCPGASADSSGLTVSGTVTLEESGTYSDDSTVGGSVALTIPKSCLPAGASCADGSSPEVGITCSDSGSDCRCTFMLSGQALGESGTWDASGTSITITPDGEDATQAEFCVEGDVLTLHAEDSDGSTTFVLSRM